MREIAQQFKMEPNVIKPIPIRHETDGTKRWAALPVQEPKYSLVNTNKSSKVENSMSSMSGSEFDEEEKKEMEPIPIKIKQPKKS